MVVTAGRGGLVFLCSVGERRVIEDRGMGKGGDHAKGGTSGVVAEMGDIISCLALVVYATKPNVRYEEGKKERGCI